MSVRSCRGSDVVAGYQADPASLPKAGDVFYAHVGFGAAIETCDGGTQYGEVDLVLPPGVSLAVDADHPITCTYTDVNGPMVPNPQCPAATSSGIYGPALAPGAPGSAWRLPAGRWFEIQFPLRSTRQLRGAAGGYCPLTVDEIATSPQNDCLGAVLGLAAGDADNPWLLAHEGLVIDPATTPPVPTPTPTPTPTPPKATPPKPTPPTPKPPKLTARVVGHVAFAHAHLAGLTHRPLTLSVRCVKRCRGTVTIAISAATAKRLRLSSHALTLARGRFAAHAGKTATVHLKVSHPLAIKVRRLRSLPVTVTAAPAGGRKVAAHHTLTR